jgi:hypothetical protein
MCRVFMEQFLETYRPISLIHLYLLVARSSVCIDVCSVLGYDAVYKSVYRGFPSRWFYYTTLIMVLQLRGVSRK